MSEGCVFCDQSWMRAAEIFIETPHCIFASTRDPDIRARAGLAEGVLPGSGAIVPIAHRTSVFELTPAEWADTQDLLLQARMALHDLLAPDGYLLGWNQGGVLHPHMHVIPRFDDEPLSDRWLRSAINVPENRRPDPWAPGSGRALRGPGERGALGLLAVRLVLLVPWAAQAVPRHRDPPSGGRLRQPQSPPLRHAP